MTTSMSDTRSVNGLSPDAVQTLRTRGFRRLLESTQIVQWEADAKTRDFTYVGSQAERLLGYPLDLWYAPDFWKTHLHEDDRQRVLLFREEALLEQEAYELEYRMIAADGHSVWAHDVVAVERVNDTPTVIRGFLIDVSQRVAAETGLRQSEERFRIAATLGADIIAEVDIQTGHVVWFGQVDEALGYESGAFPRTMEGWAEHLHSEDRDRIRTEVIREIVEKRQGLSAEFRIRARDGSYRHWTAQTAPLPRVDRPPTKFVTVCSDVTEQIVARAEALQHRDALAHVARVSSLGELTAALAHELNQPLAAILSNAQAAVRLLDRDPPETRKTAEVLRDIVADDRRAGAIIKRLRAMIRRETPARLPIDLGQVVQEVIEIMRAELATRDVTVVCDFAVDLPAVVADRIQIQQVVVNLVTNALQAMEGKAEPRLSVGVHQRNDEWQVVSVADTGSGIKVFMLDTMFEPFNTSRTGGLGMGLSISRSIIEAHGGEIMAQNRDADGAMVSFALPPQQTVDS